MMRLRRTLPGISFRADVPQRTTLPRMDIVGFVGIAASGPMHIPVPIEDISKFRAIFGDIQALAWDAEHGQWVTNQLALAVRDFFAQGGRRCWVVRASHLAYSNRFPLGGILATDGLVYRPAEVRARSAGSWSDDLSVSATALVQAISTVTETLLTDDALTLTVQSLGGTPLRAGDTLRVEFRREPPGTDPTDPRCAFVLLNHVAPTATPFGKTGQWYAVTGKAHWFTEIERDTTLDGSVAWLNTDGSSVPIPQFNRLERNTNGDLSLIFNDTTEADADKQRKTAALVTNGEAANLLAIREGDWLAFDHAGGRALLLVEQLLPLPASQTDAVQIAFRLGGAWQIGAEAASPLPVSRVTRLTLAMRARRTEDLAHRLSEMAYAAPHPRFVGYLNTDDDYFYEPEGIPQPTEAHPAAALRAEAAESRFPFAATEDGEATVFIPLALSVAPDLWHGTYPKPTPETARFRDGLVPEHVDPFAITSAQWGAHLQTMYLDDYLRFSGQGALLADAFDRRFRQGIPLRGLHSLLPIEEISIVALPDLTQPGWQLTYAPTEPPPEDAPEKPEPCARDDFLFTPKPTEIDDIEPVDEPLTVALVPPFQPTWSVLHSTYPNETMLAIHAKSVEMSAARGDMVAVLSVPHRFTAREVSAYLGDLLQQLRISSEKASTYAALYYPSVFTRDPDGVVRPTVPDGAVCGVMASRSRTRGAWVAPANDVLRYAVGSVPPVLPTALDDLYQSGVNVLRQNPQGFTVWGVHTLSDDEEWRSLNVRRLLILLRKIALRDGQRYVFEVHNDAFRRQVRQSMETILAYLFERGAFAGSTPAQAYRVVVDDTLNTPASVEQGRFIVELRVAPSQPLVFIKVRLIENGDTIVVQEG